MSRLALGMLVGSATLNLRELDRLKVIEPVVETRMKPGRAAERLGLTVRQIERLVIPYRVSGAAGLTPLNRYPPCRYNAVRVDMNHMLRSAINVPRVSRSLSSMR